MKKENLSTSTNATYNNNDYNNKAAVKRESKELPESESKKIKIQCSLKVLRDEGKGDDDIIFVKEVDCRGVEINVKIGETSQFPINVTGCNCGIVQTNPIDNFVAAWPSHYFILFVLFTEYQK